ncbi:MAG: aldehyde dehydrogenase [Sphingomonas sp.]
MERYRMFIGGRWVEAANGIRFDTIDPYRGGAWASLPRAASADVSAAIAAARDALGREDWRDLLPSARGALLRKLAELITRDADRLAEIEVRDNGKLLTEMRAQMRYLPACLNYFAGLADKVGGRVVPIDRPGTLAYTRMAPVGVVAAITPWNSPLLLAMFKLGPALAAGCTLVLKPSEYASASSLELAALVEEAGFPPGVVNVVTGFGAEIGAAIATHPDVAKVAFTGGTETGRRVYAAAAEGVKRVTMELGGKSANIVFADADIESAVNGTIAGIFAASGQSCIAGSRLLIENSIHDAFVDRLVEKASAAKLGDPMRADTQVGPVTTREQFEKILAYIESGRAEGAHCVLGGGPGDAAEPASGLFIAPTIFTGVRPYMRIAQEEIFGPVLAVMRFDSEEEAIEIANGTAFGLAAGVWTSDLTRALRLERNLEAGTVWINTYRALSVHLPFGGVKLSGVGRENGLDAIAGYLEPKSVMINLTGRMADPFSLQ